MPYMLNGQMLDISSEPRLENGTLWVPLRKVAMALGGSADWEPTNGMAIMYLGDQIATFTQGQTSADLNGQSISLQAAPVNESGEIWVPVRFLEHLGYGLSADPQNGIVDLTKEVAV